MTALGSPFAGALDDLDVVQARLRALYLGRGRLAAPAPSPRWPDRTRSAPSTRPRRSTEQRPAEAVAAHQVVPLRLATEYIERHAAEPIGLTEIAGAAQLSPRALQAAFRRHLDTTPLAHLRAVRLAGVHAELRAARPGDGRTVSAVASSWGFSQLSRFARDYQRRYGVSPRRTLEAAVQP